jgi:hypothetical protein
MEVSLKKKRRCVSKDVGGLESCIMSVDFVLKMFYIKKKNR